MVREDLLAVLQRWRARGDRVVLIMDTNKHVMDRVMCKQLTGDDLQMREVVHSETKGPRPKAWFTRSESIDGIWVSSEIDVIGVSYLPFDGSLGDHQLVMADLTMSSVLGKHLNNIVPVRALAELKGHSDTGSLYLEAGGAVPRAWSMGHSRGLGRNV